MEDKIIEVFKKYSKSVDTEHNAYNCLIEEDWSNIVQEIVKVLRQPDVIKSVCPVCKCVAGTTCAHSWHYDNKGNWKSGQTVL